jgi:protocatechuate 3,4-dioxygenase beta subunit
MSRPILTVGFVHHNFQPPTIRLMPPRAILVRAFLLCLLLGAVAGTGVVAQNPATENASASPTTQLPARATVRGAVTKDPGGEPVKKVLIELIAESQGEGGNYTAMTGVDGVFHIEGILPGRYRLFPERTGYLEVDKHRSRAEGRVLTLAAAQELKDLLIRLQATTVVEGRVTDEDGDPLPNANVVVQRQTFAAGRNRWEQAGGGPTNDLGEYRIANLPAGSYYVSVTPPPDFKNMIEAGNSTPSADKNADGPEKQTATSYMTTYYPGTRERSQASLIQLHAGDDFPANFSLTPSPSLTIRGSIVNLPAGASAVVMVRSKESDLTLTGGEMHKTGSFEIRGVPPGAYTLMAVASVGDVSMMARQPLQVISENVDGLRLAPQAGAWLRGRLRLEGKSNLGRLDAGQIFLSLSSRDPDDDMLGGVPFAEGFGSQAHVNPDGSFEWKGVPPGHYYVQLAGSPGGGSPDWFLKAVAVGNRDVTDAGFTVNGGAAVLDVVASANGAVVDGVVANAKSEPVANAVVVAVPEARLRSRTDRYHKTTTDQSGRFTLHGVPPGAYTLIAWESMDGDAYFNPEFLRNYEGQGRALQVSEGDQKSQQLTAIPAPDEEAPGN